MCHPRSPQLRSLQRPFGRSPDSPVRAWQRVLAEAASACGALLLLMAIAAPADATSPLGTPAATLYSEVAQPLLEIEAPSFTQIVAETGPTVTLIWTNPPSLSSPQRVAVLRADAGSALEEIWSCENALFGCPQQSFRDASGIEDTRSYDYRVEISDGVGFGATPVERVTLPISPPTRISIARTNAGTYEIDWKASPGAGFYKITRRNLLTGDRFAVYVDAATTKYIDTVDAGAYEYSLRACKVRTAEGACGGGSATSRRGVGGARMIHGLATRVARHRFRPEAALAVDPEGGPPSLQSERLVYRDEVTGAQVVKLTNDPQKDYHLYTNIPVWNADGSQFAYHTDYGVHWGWRIANADGSGLRDLASESLPIATGPSTQLWWNEPHFGVRWSPTDSSRLYYYDAEGHLGEMTPPTDDSAQLDLGILWEPDEPLGGGFWPIVHPDGLKAIGVHAIQQRVANEFASNSTAYLVDLPTGDLDAEMPLVDEFDVPLFAHQLWFTKALDHSFSYNGETRPGQWVASPPFGSPTVDRISSTNLQRASFSPAGDLAAHTPANESGVALTDLNSQVTTPLVTPLTGHKTWDVDPDWFVANDDDALWRIWIDGHRTQIAAPYTFLIYQGEHHTGFMPQVSPDGTKIAFKSPMHGDDDLYAATLKLPDPPLNVALTGPLLEWDPPAHAKEIASYNVWESLTSGLDFELLATVPTGSLSFDVGDPTDRFYRVTAVEHSALEGRASIEAAHTPTLARRRWFETHPEFAPQAIATLQSMAPVYGGDHTGLYAMRAIAPSAGPLDGARVTVPIPAVEYELWALTRGGGPGSHFTLYDDGVALGEFSAESADFAWQPLANPTATSIVAGELTLVPAELGIEVDQLLLSTDLGFVPTNTAMRLHTLEVALGAVSNLSANAETFHCELDWDDAAPPNFSHYDVYANLDQAPGQWDQQHRVGSIVMSRFIDWGLAPASTVHYGVVVVDRHGTESAANAVTCATPSLEVYQLELAAAPASDPHASFAPDPATGAWRFDFDIPPGLALSEFVAWVEVRSATGQILADDLTRSLTHSIGTSPARDWDLASQLFPITRVDGGAPERDARIWAFLSLADDDLHIYRAASLPSGAGHVQIAPKTGRPLPGLRISRFILTNDASFVPDGISDYLLPDTRRNEASVSPSAACDDGLDNDGDGAFDFVADPGCDDESDASERSAALACDDGVDNDADALVDLADPGCAQILDDSENSNLTQCDDGVDNDEDGEIDAADSDCVSPNTTYEEIPECDDGVDNDADTAIDFPDDDGCREFADRSERPDCSDGLDNDGDGETDAPADSGCSALSSPREDPACSDGIDNDGDGFVDFDGGPLAGEPDPGCKGEPYRIKEFAISPPQSCGLGAELALILPLLVMLQRGGRRLVELSFGRVA